MSLDKYNYTCIECGDMQTVKKYDEIINNSKLCYNCISKNNIQKAKRKPLQKYKKRKQGV